MGLLQHSLARNYGLVDGIERLAVAAVLAFYGFNGLRLSVTNDEAYDLVMAVAAGQLDDVDAIAAALERVAHPRGWPPERADARRGASAS